MCLMVTAGLAANLKTNFDALNSVHMHENLICQYKTSKAEVPRTHALVHHLLNSEVFLTHEGWTKSQLTT